MTDGKPLYIYAPYMDKPWFYVEPADPSQYPCALPYYLAVDIRGYVRFPEPFSTALEDDIGQRPDLYSKEQMMDFAKAYLAQFHAEKNGEE